MKTRKVQFFTEKEEEFVNILVSSGFTRKVAMALVFLANTEETTTRAIERGADMRQPEVSLAMKYLKGRGWIESREDGSANKGRPSKVYKLSLPISKILDVIEKDKKDETKKQMALLGKMKDFI